MALTRERKVYLGVLVIAGLAITVDKAVLRPTDASAHNLNDAVSEIDGTVGHKTRLEASAVSVDMVARIAKLLARQTLGFDVTEAGDAFAASEQWPSTAQSAASDPESADEASAEFQQNHKLTSVLLGSRRSGALIDGKFIRRGQIVDGYRLVRVESRRVVFAREGRLVVLNMERRGAPADDVSGR